MMRNNPDKRHYNRLKTNSYQIQYKINDNNTVFNAEVINISAGGICFLRTSIIEKGDILQIKFDFTSKKIVLKGEVSRIEGREVGVRFIDKDYQIERFVEYFNDEFSASKSKTIISKTTETAAENNTDNEDNIFNIDQEQ
ncbi:MAG: PilZ domain-containing protein [Spirochaetes bacterium]|nr:PilZ domain-containing protein [Spirochaetota bacterium]